MNLLEYWIKEVHNVEEIEGYPDRIRIDVTSNCWGEIRRREHITSKSQWQIDIERGYYIA